MDYRSKASRLGTATERDAESSMWSELADDMPSLHHWRAGPWDLYFVNPDRDRSTEQGASIRTHVVQRLRLTSTLQIPYHFAAVLHLFLPATPDSRMLHARLHFATVTLMTNCHFAI
jgi:hypothetical protein